MELHESTAPSAIVKSPSYDERALPEFVVPTRMGYRWRNFNHRISGWKFGLSRDQGGHPWADHLQIRSIGGPFSEGVFTQECPQIKYGYHRVGAESVRQVGAAHRRLCTVLDSSGTRRERITLDRDKLQLSGYRDIVAVITGFGFDTSIPQKTSFPGRYDPKHGYVSRGLGAEIRVTDVTEESVELSFWIRYGFGAAMERPAHNDAMLEARVGAELDVALIGVTDVPVHRGSVGYESECGDPKIAVEYPVESIPKRFQRIEIDGTASAPAGFFGVRSFNFDLTPERSCTWNRDWGRGGELRGEDPSHPRYGRPGYYIRELTVDLSRERYDRQTGEGSFLLEGFASNATYSIPFYPLSSTFTGEMVWVQAPADRRPVRFSSEFPTGESQFLLSDME